MSHVRRHPYSDAAMLLNVVLVAVPTELIAVKQTMTIKANMTAYSTAVGPSSETRKRCIFLASDFIGIPPFQFDSAFDIEPEQQTSSGSLEQNIGSIMKTDAGLRAVLGIPC